MQSAEQYIVLNLYGTRFQLERSEFDGLLSQSKDLQEFYRTKGKKTSDSEKQHNNCEPEELYLSRHVGCFEAVLLYNKTGDLHLPTSLCINSFKVEMDFWGINMENLSNCCYYKYKCFVNDMASLKIFQKKCHSPKVNWKKSGDISFRQKMYYTLEFPTSSVYSKIYVCVMGFFIIMAMFVMCANTTDAFTRELTKEEWYAYLDEFQESSYNSHIFQKFHSNDTNSTNDSIDDLFPHVRAPLFASEVMDYLCISFFTIDFILRLFSRNTMKQFLKSPLNILDIFALISLYTLHTVEFILPEERFSFSHIDFLRIFTMVRVSRVFRLLKGVTGFQVLTAALNASKKELLLLLALLSVGVLVFSSFLFIVENRSNIRSIPAAFWWAIITMTTVGYGDVVPKTELGKFISSICGVTGILTLAIVAPIFVNNFILFYNYSRGRKIRSETMNEQAKDTELQLSSRQTD